jgi:hypothetical protein
MEVHSAGMGIRRQANLHALQCNTAALISAFLQSEKLTAFPA